MKFESEINILLSKIKLFYDVLLFLKANRQVPLEKIKLRAFSRLPNASSREGCGRAIIQTLAMEILATLPATLTQVGYDLAHMGFAYILALPIGWNQEHEQRSAGIRTFPIVALATCGLALVARAMAGANPDATSRILQGMLAGIGFVGGGAIVKDQASVRGLASAASIWNVAIAGAAVGLGIHHVAITLCVINFLTLRYLLPWKKEIAQTTRPEDQDR